MVIFSMSTLISSNGIIISYNTLKQITIEDIVMSIHYIICTQADFHIQRNDSSCDEFDLYQNRSTMKIILKSLDFDNISNILLFCNVNDILVYNKNNTQCLINFPNSYITKIESYIHEKKLPICIIGEIYKGLYDQVPYTVSISSEMEKLFDDYMKSKTKY